MNHAEHFNKKIRQIRRRRAGEAVLLGWLGFLDWTEKIYYKLTGRWHN